MSDPGVSELPCPDAETLGVLLEGGLRPFRRRRLFTHIGACDGCYEIFTGAARFRLEERARSGGVESVVQRPLGPPAVAAAALAALLAGVLVLSGPALDSVPVDTVLARQAASVRLPTALGEPRVHPWSYSRSAGEAEIGWRESFRLGVLLTDWAAASSAGDRAALARLVAELRRSTAGLALEGTSLEGVFDDLARDGEAGAGPRAGFALAADRLRGTAAWESLRLGAWAEAARLAAVAGDRRYFQRPATSRLVADLPSLALPAGIEARLAASLQAGREAADGRAWPEVVESFSRLVAEVGRYATDPSGA
jgi:hypothetical protein